MAETDEKKQKPRDEPKTSRAKPGSKPGRKKSQLIPPNQKQAVTDSDSCSETVSAGHTAKFIRHAMAAWNLPAIDISDEKQVEERIEWYFNQCAADDVKPGVEGMCNALGITRDTLWRWANGITRGSTHSDSIKRAYAILRTIWEANMQSSTMNPVAGIFIAKNQFGYKDQTELKVATNGEEATIPQEQLEEKYRDLLTDGTIEGEATEKD